MMMDNLPSSRFSTIDVRDPIGDGHRLASKYKRSTLDPKFIGHIASDLNELITQFNSPLWLSGLLAPMIF
jgi:hypothetical protein